ALLAWPGAGPIVVADVDVKAVLAHARHVMHGRKPGILGDDSDGGRVCAESEAAATRVLCQAPDWRTKLVLQPQRQTAQHWLVFVEPGQAVNSQARIRKGDVLPLR